MADLGLIDSKRGLYIKINVNNGQNKFEVHISKNVAKMAILWPKIGQHHFGARASHHQILTNEHTKMTSSLRRINKRKVSIKEKFIFTSQSNYILYMIYTKLVMNSKSVYKFT